MLIKKRFYLSKLILIFLCVFLTVQYCLLGIARVPDTAALESFSHAVYPLYPLVLFIFRYLFGENMGYCILGLFQNLLLAFSIFSLVEYIRIQYQLPYWLSFLASVCVVSLFLAQKWLTRSGIISSNTLFSEALAIPLYFLFIRHALETCISRKMNPFLFSCLLALCLILTRGQLYWVLAVVFIIGLRVNKWDLLKRIATAVLACVAIVACVQGGRYFQTLHYSFDQTKNPANLIVFSTAVYCSKTDDCLLYDEGSGERRMLESAHVFMDDPNKQIAFSYESGSLVQRYSRFEMGYDELKEILNRTYKELTYEGVSISLMKMTFDLIISNPGSFFLHCAQNALVAMVRTVSILRPLLDIYAFIFFVFIMILLIISKRNQRLAHHRQFVCLVLLCSLLNAFVMAPGVFALSRYVFYNMPVMYLSVFILFFEIIREEFPARKCLNCYKEL